MRVLIVEDEALIALHLEMLVTELGHHVCSSASSAAGAITEVAVHSPDVVLMDVRLANGGSGIEAAGEIYTRYGIRCIFLSANLDEGAREAVRPYEPIDYIGKPILPVALQQALAKAEKRT